MKDEKDQQISKQTADARIASYLKLMDGIKTALKDFQKTDAGKSHAFFKDFPEFLNEEPLQSFLIPGQDFLDMYNSELGTVANVRAYLGRQENEDTATKTTYPYMGSLMFVGVDANGNEIINTNIPEEESVNSGIFDFSEPTPPY